MGNNRKQPDNSRALVYVLLKKYGLTGALRLFWSDVLFDFWHRVDTARPVSNSRLFGAAGVHEKNRYVPSTFQAIDSALGFLRDNCEEVGDFSCCRFVDLGSGKGKALIAAARWPFVSLSGIELSPLLHEISLSNMRKLNLDRRISLLNQDATKLWCADSDKVFYFFNPFTGQTLEQCLSIIEKAGRVTKRYIIYVNPTEDDVYRQHFALLAKEIFQPGDVEVNFYATR